MRSLNPDSSKYKGQYTYYVITLGGPLDDNDYALNDYDYEAPK